MDSKGRKNYTDREKTLFIDIIARKKSAIENRRTSVQAIRARAAAWKDVVREFNASADHPRTLKQLKILYDNLKRRARKDLAAEQQRKFQKNIKDVGIGEDELQSYTEQAKEEQILEKMKTFKTGGGSSNAPGVSGTSLQILSILGDTVAPVANILDSAATYHKDTIELPFSEDIIKFEIIPPASPPTARTPSPYHQPSPKRQNIKTRRQAFKPKKINYKEKYFKQKYLNSLTERKIFLTELKIKQKQLQMLNNQ